MCKRASVIPTGKIATLSPMTPVDPPAHLPESAIEVWRATIEAMAAAKTLDAGCLPAVERYVTAVCRWREAERHLADEGAVLRAAKTGVPSVNVWHSIGRAAAAQVTRLEAELGLVPARRSRIWQADKEPRSARVHCPSAHRKPLTHGGRAADRLRVRSVPRPSH